MNTGLDNPLSERLASAVIDAFSITTEKASEMSTRSYGRVAALYVQAQAKDCRAVLSDSGYQHPAAKVKTLASF